MLNNWTMRTLFLACLLLMLDYAQAGQNAASPRPVIFDTDMAIDDWSALLVLAKDPGINLQAVTIAASGESHCQPGLDNASSLLDLAHAPAGITIACGDEVPLDGYFVFPQAWREDADSLSGVAVKKSARKVSAQAAHEIIHRFASGSEQPLTLVAVGPLTNIARWLIAYPADKARIERLVIMGGSVRYQGNIRVPNFTDGHPNLDAEWNFFVDPLAVQIVMQSGLDIDLVGLDVTRHVQVTRAYVDTFRQHSQSDAAHFFDQVFVKNGWFIDSGEYYFWDVLAALVTIEPALCEGPRQPVDVSVVSAGTQPYLKTSDVSMPNTRWDGQPRQHLDAALSGISRYATSGPSIHVCLQTQPQRALERFTATMNRLP